MAIPTDFTPQGGTSNYLKLTQGKHRLRILGEAISGWVWWTETKDGGRHPNRVSSNENPPVEFADDLRKFLAFPVWNYELNKIQIWEITQPGIQKELTALEKDKDWGELLDYDIEVERTGMTKTDTRYRITPKPKVTAAKEIIEAMNNSMPNLEALFLGQDPFNSEGLDLSDLELDKTLAGGK